MNAPTSEKTKVLLIENEPEIRESIIDSISNPNFEFSEASNGRDGLEIIRSIRPDIVISDFNMPVMNGLELLKALKEAEDHTPIIWLTGRGSFELYRQAWALGIFEYLEKPFLPQDLNEKVMSLLSLSRSTETASDPFVFKTVSETLYREASIVLSRERYELLVAESRKRGLSASSLIEQLIDLHFANSKKRPMTLAPAKEMSTPAKYKKA